MVTASIDIHQLAREIHWLWGAWLATLAVLGLTLHWLREREQQRQLRFDAFMAAVRQDIGTVSAKLAAAEEHAQNATTVRLPSARTRDGGRGAA